jgi:hypothetical protein
VQEKSAISTGTFFTIFINYPIFVKISSYGSLGFKTITINENGKSSNRRPSKAKTPAKHANLYSVLDHHH